MLAKSRVYKALSIQRQIRERKVKADIRFISNNPFLFTRSVVDVVEGLARMGSVFRNGKWQGANHRGKNKEKAFE